MSPVTQTLIALIIVTVISWPVLGYIIYDDARKLALLRATVEDLRTQKDRQLQSTNQAYQAVDQLHQNLTQYQIAHPANPDRAQLVDQLLATETDDLERAQGAWYRLKEEVQVQLSVNEDGTGPLFSASKPAMAERALLTVINQSQSDEEDWDIVSKWLVNHPGQHDKLG